MATLVIVGAVAVVSGDTGCNGSSSSVKDTVRDNPQSPVNSVAPKHAERQSSDSAGETIHRDHRSIEGSVSSLQPKKIAMSDVSLEDAREQLRRIASKGFKQAQDKGSSGSVSWSLVDVRVDVKEASGLMRPFVGAIAIHTVRNDSPDCFRIYYVYENGHWKATWGNRGSIKFYNYSDWKASEADASNAEPGYTIENVAKSPLLSCFLD